MPELQRRKQGYRKRYIYQVSGTEGSDLQKLCIGIIGCLEDSAVVYTMVEMAKTHNLSIYRYLGHLLQQRPDQ